MMPPMMINTIEEAREMAEKINQYAAGRRAEGDECDIHVSVDGMRVRLTSTKHTSDRKIDVVYVIPFDYNMFDIDLMEADC